jgi:hypothetical protein
MNTQDANISRDSARTISKSVRRAVFIGTALVAGLTAVACSSSSSEVESSGTTNKGMYVKIVNNTAAPIEAAYFRGGFCLDETTGCTTIASLSSTIAPGAEFTDGFSTAGLCDVGVLVTAAVAPDQPIKLEGGANGSITQFQAGADSGSCDKAPAVKIGSTNIYKAGTTLEASITRLPDSNPILTEMEVVVSQP